LNPNKMNITFGQLAKMDGTIDVRLICDGPDEDGNYLFLTCGKLNAMGSCKLDELTFVEFDKDALMQRLVDVLDAMWLHYTPTNDARYNAARDVLNKAEKAGIRPPDGGLDIDEFDNRPRNRFGVPSDEVL